MDPLDELARIRGQIHSTPAPTPVTVNMVEVEMMIEMAIREARKDWMREMEVLLSNFQPDHSLRSLVTDLQYQVKELQTQLTKPIDPSVGIPPVEEITKKFASSFGITKRILRQWSTIGVANPRGVPSLITCYN